MSLPETFTLNTGAKIPTVAIGTYAALDEEVYKSVQLALERGYRHIDTASFYKNEEPIGRAIKDSGIPREELFVTSKAWPTQFADIPGALEESLKKLQLDYLDLYLQHWPQARKPDPKDPLGKGLEDDTELTDIDVWKAFQELPTNKVKAVGVSNYTSARLEKLLKAKSTKTVPAVNQVEMHPSLPQPKLVDFCQKNGIIVEAYTPLAKGELDNPILVEIAKAHNVDAGQVALSWNVQRGVVVLPKSVTPSRIESNKKLIKLSDAEMNELKKMGTTPHRLVIPSLYTWDLYENNADS